MLAKVDQLRRIGKNRQSPTVKEFIRQSDDLWVTSVMLIEQMNR
jgi:hypothetical protein